MALITRMTRLFTADLHAVLDRLEEPDVLLKQALREMQDDLALREHHVRCLEHECEQATQHAKELDRELIELAQQLDVCFVSNQEHLARTLLKRKLEMEQLAKRLYGRADAATKAFDLENAQIAENQQAFETLRQQAELLLDETSRSDSSGRSGMYRTNVTDADVEVALLREKQRRGQS